MRSVIGFVACAAMASLIGGCTSTQRGPYRPTTIEQDVEYTRPLFAPDLNFFYSQAPATQAAVRNQIVTARMYVADVAYHEYESNLTREMQNEGLLATATSLGLTTSATLVDPAQTKTVLAALATAVTGFDKAYNEKVLLANTMQALQTQMRADRKTQAAVIFAKMSKDVGNAKLPTPIDEYTLPMALSDADRYYQAGTIASALIGLSKTLANADHNADQAKADAGPNPGAVSAARETAAPRPIAVVPTLRVTNVARDRSYPELRSLLFPGGARTADPELVAYVRRLLGNEKIAIGPILADARFTSLRQRLSACIIARRSGSPCADGSLSQFVQ